MNNLIESTIERGRERYKESENEGIIVVRE
jgi:hypothetical protein